MRKKIIVPIYLIRKGKSKSNNNSSVQCIRFTKFNHEKSFDHPLGLSKSLTYEYILTRYASIGSLHEQRYIQSLMLVYKSVNNDGPTYINELFKLKIVKYNLRGIVYET